MVRGLRSGIFQFACLLVLFAVCGCAYNGQEAQTTETRPSVWPSVPTGLVTPAQLSGSGLEMVWRNELPLKAGETITNMVVTDNRLYVLTDFNFLVSLDRNDGTIIFSRFLAKPGFPLTGLGQYEDEFFTMEGGKLVALNSQTGKDVSSTGFDFSVACPVVRNSSFYYVAGTDRCIRALRAADKVKLFEVAADDGSTITSIAADEQSATFVTDTGRCISFAPDSFKYLWKFSAADAIAVPVVKTENSVFFASRDTHVYRLEAETGQFVWKCPMGALLEKGPDVAGKCVYIYTRGKGLTAIDRENGKILWQLPEGVALLAEAWDKAYVTAGLGRITVMDIVGGQKLSTISIPGISKYAVNVVDEKIYVADYSGRIACLEPAK